MTTKQIGSQITMLQKLNENYEKKTESEKERIEQLKKEIIEIQKNIELERKNIQIARANRQQESNEEIVKQIKSQEKQLDIQLTKYNEAVANNRLLRLQIDDLRKERNVQMDIDKKLKIELNAKKKELEKELTDVEEIFMKKEQLSKKLKEKKAEAEEFEEKNKEELRKYEFLISNEDKLKDKNEDDANQLQKGKKGKSSSPTKNLRKDQPQVSVKAPETFDSKPIEKQSSSKDTNIRSPTMTQKGAKGKSFSNQNHLHHVQRSDILTDKKEIHLSSQNQVKQYKEAFKKCFDATGIDSIEGLVDLFTTQEMKNFSKFNFLKDSTAEKFQLEEEIKQTEAEIQKYKKLVEVEQQKREENINMHKKNKAAEIKPGQKHRLFFEDEEEEKDWRQTMKVLNALKVGIQNIFENIGCANEHTQELVGNHGVTESNMMQYLGIIEMRTNEILQMYAACQSKGLEHQQAANNTQQPVFVYKEREKNRDNDKIEAPDSNIFEEQKKRSAENERRKKEFDEDEGRLHPVVEKGEDPDDADILTVKEFQKKAQEFVKENFDKHRKKNQKPKPNQK